MGMAIDLAAERGESLKAGVGGALGFTIPCIFATIINEIALPQFFQGRHAAFLSGAGPWIGLGAAVSCGFLFGVTYRYARRTDTNLFLQQGVVLAFGLTRAAGAIAPDIHWLSWGILNAEGIIGYGIAAMGLDWAFRQGWMQPPEVRSERGN